ncbi:lantibiotic dehydratase family protein [Streptomyces niveus]|uniref:lantibiotic dehydratase family protein n=1 Tax=Streptomyces niveus TaxID=193462 RepID=UPI0036646F78
MTTPEHAYAEGTSGGSGVSGGAETSQDPVSAATGPAAADGFDLDVRILTAPGTEDGMRQLVGEERRPPKAGTGHLLQYGHWSHFLVRAAPYADLGLPPWPDLDGSSRADAAGWCDWMRSVWAIPSVAEAVRHASPDLADEMERLTTTSGVPSIKRARRACLSLVSYLLRLTTRVTPFGLNADVGEGEFREFGRGAAVRWGDENRALVRAGGVWLADAITRLEQVPSVRERLPVLLNNAAIVRGGRLVVPFTVRGPGSRSTAIDEVSVRRTAPVRTAMDLAQEPVSYRVLANKLRAEYPAPGEKIVRELLDRLIEARVLITSLQPPSTVVDALGHVLAQLHQAHPTEVPEAAGTVEELRAIHRLMGEHSHLPLEGTAQVREELAKRMGALSAAPNPLALDVRLDCEMKLPNEVAAEAAAAATVLTRINPHPYGTPAWREYHRRFVARYGLDALVPVGDLLDPDIGLGVPRGYLGAAPRTQGAVTARDRRLLTLAQLAAQGGREEVVLDEDIIGELATGDPTVMRPRPHLNLIAAVHAESRQALQQGNFTLVLSGLTGPQGTMSDGRFAPLLEAGWRMGGPGRPLHLARRQPHGGSRPARVPRPGRTRRTCCPYARTPARAISVSEHRAPSPGPIPPADLALAADHHSLYLMSLSTRTRLEPTIVHALRPKLTPVLARLLAEVVRARTTRGHHHCLARRAPRMPVSRKPPQLDVPVATLLAHRDGRGHGATCRHSPQVQHSAVSSAPLTPEDPPFRRPNREPAQPPGPRTRNQAGGDFLRIAQNHRQILEWYKIGPDDHLVIKREATSNEP